MTQAEADSRLLRDISDTIHDIAFDIRMEHYGQAEKKIGLLEELLQTINKDYRKR